MVKIKNKKSVWLVLGVLLAILGWYFFPSDSRIIKRQLFDMAQQISFPQSEHPLETLKRSRIIASYMAGKIKVRLLYEGEEESRELSNSDVQQRIFASSKSLAPVNVDLEDLKIQVSNDSATARFTAIISRANTNSAATAEKYAQEIESLWGKIDGKWRLQEIKNIEVIEWQQ